MRQFNFNSFSRLLRNNGFLVARTRGDHTIFKNKDGRHVSVPKTINPCVAQRLIKENNLKSVFFIAKRCLD